MPEREVDKFIRSLQESSAWWRAQEAERAKKAPEPKKEKAAPEPEEATTERIDAARTLRERLRRKPRQKPVPGLDRGIRSGEAEER